MVQLLPPFARKKSKVEDNEIPARTTKSGSLSRSLTLPLQDPQRVGLRRIKQRTLDQTSSSLLMLPAEIREGIYRYMIGGRCVAQDISGCRIGDSSDPWPAWERPGGDHRRGLKAWGYQPTRPHHFISILLTCRQIYSETINMLYASNLFYFRNPFTNWTFSMWQVLPKRLAQIRVLILDETIGDPSIILAKRSQWQRVWRTVAKMSRLRVLYLNIDTLYPKAWTPALERRLMSPLQVVTQPVELHIVVRWSKPDGVLQEDYPKHIRDNLARVEDWGQDGCDFHQHHRYADMREWISQKLSNLERGIKVETRRI